MLGGKISNQDEEEVEDELAALQAELTREHLPVVPDSPLPVQKNKPEEQPSKVKPKQKEPERQAMLAA